MSPENSLVPKRIGTRTLTQKPSVVASLIGPTLDMFASQANTARSEGADILEVRADCDNSSDLHPVFTTLTQIKDTTGLPIILTIRHKDEMGGFKGTEEERLEAFQTLAPAADAVDIESQSGSLTKAVITLARDLKKFVIVSHHDFVKTPDNDTLKAIMAEAISLYPDMVKTAYMMQHTTDVLPLCDHCQMFRESGNIISLTAISMGELGRFYRLLNPWLAGQSLSYGHVGERSAAPGQIPVKQLRQMVDALPNQQPTRIRDIVIAAYKAYSQHLGKPPELA